MSTWQTHKNHKEMKDPACFYCIEIPTPVWVEQHNKDVDTKKEMRKELRKSRGRQPKKVKIIK